MNRRGYISITRIFIVIMVITVLALAQNKVDSSSIDKAINTLNWTNLGKNISIDIENAAQSNPNEIVKVILKATNKAVDFFGYTIFEVTKLAMTTARDNPDIINYKVLFVILILSLLAPVIYPLFIIIVSIFLIIKEWFANRKEKKEL